MISCVCTIASIELGYISNTVSSLGCFTYIEPKSDLENSQLYIIMMVRSPKMRHTTISFLQDLAKEKS